MKTCVYILIVGLLPTGTALILAGFGIINIISLFDTNVIASGF